MELTYYLTNYSYFIAANPSIERHLYSVPLPTSVSHLAEIRAGKAQPVAPTKYTETRERGHYTVSFSPFGGVYQLNYGQSLLVTAALLRHDGL